MASLTERLEALRNQSLPLAERVRLLRLSTPLADEQGGAAEVKRRAAAGEPIVQTGLRRASRGQEIQARAAGAVAGAVEGLLGVPAVAADVASAPVRAMAAGAGALREGEGLGGAMGAAAESAVAMPVTRATTGVADRVQSALGPSEDVATSATPAAIRLGVDVAMPGPEVGMFGKAVRAGDATNAAVKAAPSPQSEVKQYLAANPETPREARSQLFADGLSDEQRATIAPPEKAPAPKRETKFGAVKDRWLTTATTALRRSGRVGEEIANKLEVVQRDSVQMASRPVEALKALRRLADDEKEQFIDLLEGKIDAGQTTARVRNLATVHRHFLNEFGAKAEQAGLQLRLADGTVVPFARRDDYFPHIRPDDPDAPIFVGANEMKPGERVGSLEHAREGDAPFLRDPLAALATYYSGAARKLAEVKHFGPDIPKAVREYTERATAGGEAPEFISEAMTQTLGGGPRPNAAMRGLASDLMNAQVMLKLPTAVIGNATQTAYTIAKAGFRNTAGALMDLAKSKITNDPQLLDEAIASGATLESLVNELVAGRHTDLLARGARGVLRASGFLGVESFNRLLAAQAGIRTAEQLANVAKGAKSLPWYGVTGARDRAVRDLQKMGVDVDAFKTTGQLTPQDKMNAGYYMSHKTQFGTRHEDLPLGFTSSPTAKVLMQFKGFSFKSAKFIKDELVKPLYPDLNVMPLARFLLAAGVVGGTSETVRDFLFGKLESLADLDAQEQFVDGMIAMAMGNIVGGLYRSAQYGGTRGVREFLVGPNVGDANRTMDAVGAVIGGNDPVDEAAKLVTRTVPITRAIDNRLNP